MVKHFLGNVMKGNYFAIVNYLRPFRLNCSDYGKSKVLTLLEIVQGRAAKEYSVLNTLKHRYSRALLVHTQKQLAQWTVDGVLSVLVSNHSPVTFELLFYSTSYSCELHA